MSAPTAGLDWNALLQKAEKAIGKFEEGVGNPGVYCSEGHKPVEMDEVFDKGQNGYQCKACGRTVFPKTEDFHTQNEPLTGIEDVRGVEHAYYEKQLAEMGKLLEEAEALMNQKVSPTQPVEVSRTEESEYGELLTHLNESADTAWEEMLNLKSLIDAVNDAVDSGAMSSNEAESHLSYVSQKIESGLQALGRGVGMKESESEDVDKPKPIYHVASPSEYAHALLSPTELPKKPQDEGEST